MYNPSADLITLEDIYKAKENIKDNANFVRTPMIKNAEKVLGVQGSQNITLHLKLENMQVTGSFKARGVLNQFLNLPEDIGTPNKKLISMSAGNYGKSFAFMSHKFKKSGIIIMPETAPTNRAQIIQNYGVEVERHPSSELQSVVDKYVKETGAVYLHSFDDTTLIAGHATAGLEILEDVPEPDIILVCCGGGGLLSGVASAIRLSGHTDCKIFGVEPQGSRTMYESYKEDKAVSMSVSSVASGLSPPFAGKNTYKHCKKHVNGILLVSDEEIISSMFHLYNHGLLVEPSGAAAFAALHHNKVPDVTGKCVVVMITGGNVTPEELLTLSKKGF